MRNPIFLFLICVGLFSCEKATVVEYNDPFCPTYKPQYSFSGSVKLNGVSFPFNQFNAYLSDSTSNVSLDFQESNNYNTHISLSGLPLNDTLFASADSSIYFMSAGQSHCDAVFTCFWHNGTESYNWALLSSTDSIHYNIKVNSWMYEIWASGSNCTFYQDIKDSIQTEISIDFQKL